MAYVNSRLGKLQSDIGSLDTVQRSLNQESLVFKHRECQGVLFKTCSDKISLTGTKEKMRE